MFEMERVCSMNVLERFCQKTITKSGGSIDNVDLSHYLRTLQTAILTGNYRPRADKLHNYKDRIVSISSPEDKIVQSAVAEIIVSTYIPPQSVHGFIKDRSIFTAKQSLDDALSKGISEFSKIDIKRFYDSIDKEILLTKIKQLIGDRKFIQLVKLLLNMQHIGISTGSCLSPALSNLYLYDFDNFIEQKSQFYARYVDDILVAPAENIDIIGSKLSELELEVHPSKSKIVSTVDGFRYLGFDIKHTIDSALQKKNFALAEKIYKTQESDISTNTTLPAEKTEKQKPNVEYAPPNHIANILSNCHIIRTIVSKAKTEKYLSYPDKTSLLQVLHCLGKDGAEYIHHVLSHCIDYDYAETQRHIKRYSASGPVGCKKLSERYNGKDKCTCNFSKENIYPTPIIYARRIKENCFVPNTQKDNIEQFKPKIPQRKAEDALSSLFTLNKKAYEIQEQQNILKGQIESLFEKTNTSEIQTPHGLLVKKDDGIFVKVG